MKLSSLQLEAFFAVARTGSFTKAAAHVNVTQSALSQRVANLEAELETTLFIRDRAGLTLTEVARDLFRYCDVQDQFESQFLSRLRSGSKSNVAGLLKIAGFSSVMRSIIQPVLSELAIEHLEIRMQLQTRELGELLPMLKRGETDFIICDREIKRDELECISLGSERNVLITKKGSPGKDVYLDHDENDQTTRVYLKLAGGKHREFKRHYLDDIYGVIDGVRQGLGRAVVPEHLIRHSKDFTVLNKAVALEVPLCLHFYRQPFHNRLHEIVVERLRQRIPLALTSR